MRACGILMHISSLPSKYGIGTIGQSAYEFVDFLAKSRQKYWQILPIGPTAYGDSPYSSLSSFAGNPYFIDLELLCDEGALTKEECESFDFGDNITSVDYGKLFENRYKLLRLAFERDYDEVSVGTFRLENSFWLEDFALYMALKFEFEFKAWYEWPEDIKRRTPEALDKYREKLKEEINFHCYLQYKFFKQWEKLKAYANASNIKIIGDLPIYAAADSSDVWSNTELFSYDENLNPIEVSGCPPDAFSADGQLWGNPCYNWKVHKQENFDWWIRRIASSFGFYDTLRIDHFRGFSEYWAIPAGDDTAKNGTWKKGPGKEFFDILKSNLGEADIIAEDLGVLTDDVRELLAYTAFPGMKVLQFAFDGSDSDYLPHNLTKNSVIYTGTHDNNTLLGWLKGVSTDELKRVINYLDLSREENYSWGIIKHIYMSVCRLCIIPMQDYLELGSEARMNHPSVTHGNWKWRMEKSADTEDLTDILSELVQRYYR